MKDHRRQTIVYMRRYPRRMHSEFAYPEAEENPTPRHGTEAEWCDWANGLTVNQQYGVRCVSFKRGSVMLEVPEHPARPNPNGSIHGGVMAAIMDEAAGCAFVSAADANTLPATASLTVDYLRPAFTPLRIEARVTSVGRSLSHCDVVAYGADGKLTNRARAIMAVKLVGARRSREPHDR